MLLLLRPMWRFVSTDESKVTPAANFNDVITPRTDLDQNTFDEAPNRPSDKDPDHVEQAKFKCFDNCPRRSHLTKDPNENKLHPSIINAEERVLINDSDSKAHISALFTARSDSQGSCYFDHNITAKNCTDLACGEMNIRIRGNGCMAFVFLQPNIAESCFSIKQTYFDIMPTVIVSRKYVQLSANEVLMAKLMHQCDDINIKVYMNSTAPPRDTVLYPYDNGPKLMTSDTNRIMIGINQFGLDTDDDLIKFDYTLKEIIFDLPQKCACRSGFVAIYCQCFSLAFSTKPMTWSQAILQCTSAYNGSLLTLSGEQEYKYLQELIRGEWGRRRLLRSNAWIFIGLQRIKKNGTNIHEDRWINGGALAWSDWYHPTYADQVPDIDMVFDKNKMQPNADPNYLCTAMYVGNDRSFWIKLPCTYPAVRVGYLCKEPGVLQTTNQQPASTTPSITEYEVNCPNDWFLYQNRCFMILSAPNISNCEGTELGSSYAKLAEMCVEFNATFARLNSSVTENPRLQNWLKKMRPQYGSTLFYQNKTENYDLLESKPDITTNNRYLRLFDTSVNFSDTVDKVEPCNANSSFNYFLQSAETEIDLSFASNVMCSREAERTSRKCLENMFQCNDGTCISIDRRCDHVPYDCFDGSDELSCVYSHDHLGHFVCDKNTTMPYSRVCDFIRDCPQGQDERCYFPKCTDDQYRCSNMECVAQSEKCNFIHACRDGSDEMREVCDNTCATLPCVPKVACRGFTCFSGKCIPESQRGDLVVDCGLSEEDEQISIHDIVRGNYLFFIRFLTTQTLTRIDLISDNSSFCKQADYARCHEAHAHCFDRKQICIYDHDISGYLKGCRDGAHLRDCADFPCIGMFKCPDSYCLPLRKVCDAVQDCMNGEDEDTKLCAERSCSGGFRCKGRTSCLDLDEVCDGFMHCPESHDDERLCSLPECPIGCTCIGFEISCVNANLNRFTFETYTQTRSLTLAQNRIFIRNDSFQNYIWLLHLNLSTNSIVDINEHTFEDLHNLLNLDLSGNKISKIVPFTFRSLLKLKTLILIGNPIFSIKENALYGLHSLPSLDLKNFNLGILESKIFADLPSLVKLNLSSCNIRTVEDGVFRSLPRLKILDIRLNKIDVLEEEDFQNLALSRLYTDAFRFCCAANSTIPNLICTPEHDEFSNCFDLMANRYLQVAIWVLGVLACVGNIGVLIYRLKCNKHLVTSFLIMNLSIADLLMGIYLIIIAGADTVYRGTYVVYDDQWRQHPLCKLAGTMNLLSSEMSVVILVIISTDRVVAITFPFRFKRLSMKTARIILAVAWCCGLILCLIPLINRGYFLNFYGRNAPCLPFNINMSKGDSGWVFSFAIVMFNFVSFILIVISYIVIYGQVKRSQSALKGSRNGVRSSEMAFLSKISVIVATNFCCWFPVLILELMSLNGLVIKPVVSAWIAVFVLPVNASVNPYLYTLSAVNSNRRGSVSAAHTSTKNDIYSVSKSSKSAKQERIYYTK